MFTDNGKFRGVIPPLVTPLDHEENIDEPGMRKLVDHVISGGVHGVFLMGTTGEATRITDGEYEKAINIVVEQVDHRAAVLVGCSDFGTRRTLERIRTVEKTGADAVVVTPSYYLPGFTQTEIAKHYTTLAQESKLPVFVYDLPANGNSVIDLDTVDKLSQVENIAGVKDSSQDLLHLTQLIEQFKDRQDFGVFVGTEVLLAKSIALGATGCVPSIANVEPAICVSLYEALVEPDLERARELEAEMMAAREKVYYQGESNFAYIAGIKAALAAIGISGQTVTEPFSLT